MQTVKPHEGWIARDAGSLLSLFEGALAPHSHLGWSHWLQGEVQRFLPHEVVIAAWGDFRGGPLQFEVIASSACAGWQAATHELVAPLMNRLYATWTDGGQQPVALDAADLAPLHPALPKPSFCALVHGVEDHRGRYNCLYLFLGSTALASPFSRQMCRVMLPFIDVGFRQLPKPAGTSAFPLAPEAHSIDARGVSQQAAPRHGADEPGAPLSARELEIMEWVRMGKTNSEIAIILNLSTFTVKNHMRRIYKKLDVLNRAQAVGSLARMHGAAGRPGR